MIWWMDGSFLTADSVMWELSAVHYGSDAATGADHGRSSQVNACFYTHRYVYIIPASLVNPVSSLLVWFGTAWRMEQNVGS